MNAVIALCHFCEFHGPSVLFCTQAFHCTEHDPVEGCKITQKDVGILLSRRPSQTSATDFPPTSQKSSQQKTSQCEACRSLPADHPGFLSVDEQAHVSYTSSRNPAHQDVYSVVRQACVRSLSCEMCPGREGPIYFGEDANGYVLSHTFFLKDTQARGLQRWYSIIIVMMDRIYLINSWSFLVKHFKEIIDKLQKMAVDVFNSERAGKVEGPGRFRHANLASSDVLRRQHKGSFRAIEDLTRDKNLFQYLHQYFSWILKAGARRLTEKVLEGPPREELLTDFEAQQQEDDESSQKTLPETASSVEEATETSDNDCPCFISLRQMLQILGYGKFHLLAFHVIQGNQLIVRGEPKKLVLSVLQTLKILIPSRCFRCVSYSDIYEESWRCNFLGLQTNVNIPSHIFESDLYVLLDIKERESSAEKTSVGPFRSYSFALYGKENSQSPLVLKKTEEALLNQNFCDSVVDQELISIKEEWMDKVKVIFKFSRSGPRTSEEKERLFKILNARAEDEIVLKFWMTGLNREYRSHLLNCTSGASSAVQSNVE